MAEKMGMGNSLLIRELSRKAIHFAGISYIPAYIYLGKELTALCIAFLILLALFLEVFRFKYGIFNFLARKEEERSIGAHIYSGIAMLIVTVLFPKNCCFLAAITSFLGDGVAGIVRLRFPNLASPAMFLSSVLSSNFLEIPLSTSIPPALISTIAERTKKIRNIRLQDNLTVPLITALACFIISL